MNKLAFVGPETLHKFLQENYSEWDFQDTFSSASELNSAINGQSNKSIDEETSVILFFSRLFELDKEKFSQLAAFLSPYSAVCILIPEEDKANYKSEIQRTIKKEQLKFASQDDSFNSNTPFYFVTYENFEDEFFEAIGKYVTSPIIDDDVKNIVRKILPESEEVDYEVEEFSDYKGELKVIKNPNAKGKIVTFTSSKGGSGKSTLTISTTAYIRKASELAFEQGLRTEPLKIVVADLDIKDGQLAFLNNAMTKGVNNIINVLISSNGRDITEDDVKSGIYHNPNSNVDYLFASKKPRNANEIDVEFYYKVISKLQDMYDLVVLDTSVDYLSPLLEKVAYPLSDYIVLVTDMGSSSIGGMSRWISEIVMSPDKDDDVLVKNENVGIVVNKVMPNVNLDPDELEKNAKGIEIISFVPNLPTFITRNANTGELHKNIYHSSINESIKNIVDKILPNEKLINVPTTI